MTPLQDRKRWRMSRFYSRTVSDRTIRLDPIGIRRFPPFRGLPYRTGDYVSFRIRLKYPSDNPGDLVLSLARPSTTRPDRIVKSPVVPEIRATTAVLPYSGEYHLAARWEWPTPQGNSEWQLVVAVFQVTRDYYAMLALWGAIYTLAIGFVSALLGRLA